MNSIEKHMLDVLRELKDEYGVKAVKAEFEAEGSRLDELIMLNEVVFRADMDLFIKIGGCEAVRDMDQSKLLGATGIMAPMIETPFAMRKFKGAANKVYKDDIDSIDWIINAETKTCRENFDDILREGEGFLDSVTIGRDDLTLSMGLTKSDVESDLVYNAAEDFAKKSKEKGLKVGIGGGISVNSFSTLSRMREYLDRFETRKIVFDIDQSEDKLKKGLSLAIEFEILYLQNKCRFYGEMEQEDENRVEILRSRLGM